MGLTRSSASALGNVRVVISNFIDRDPTGSGEAMAPMSTDVIATALAGNAAGASATASFGTVRFPAGTTEVLVEVFDMTDSTRMASARVTLASLAASGLALAL